MLRWEALKSAYVCSQNVDTQTVSEKKKDEEESDLRLLCGEFCFEINDYLPFC